MGVECLHPMFWPFHRRRREKELAEELESHLEMAARDRVERGQRPDDARANARREFGNVALVAEATRAVWGWVGVERVLQDIRFGTRLLRRSPGFAAVAILCVALGIGVTSTIFAAVDAL